MDENVLKEYISFLKKDKYKNIVDLLKAEVQVDGEGMFIYLSLIKIKKSQMNKGYGSAIMSDIIKFADEHNVRIKLWATSVYGSNLKRLIAFYKKQGFFLIKKFKSDNEMVYKPKKIKKKL
jgi:GNAT superfamily N-acetyltransferase